MTLTMRAAVITGPYSTEIREVPAPTAIANQVRVRVSGCGICGSIFPLWEGRPWFDYPREPGAPGHEAWGVVDQVGDTLNEPLLGKRVALLSHHSFAEYDVADATHMVTLPAALDELPFPGEAVGCALNVFRRAGVRPLDHVAVVGAGFLGTLLVQLAASVGARPIAISRRPFALDVARLAGAVETLPMHDHKTLIEQVMAITGGRGCQVVFEAVGEQWPLELAGELTAERGRLVIAGYHQDPRQVNLQLWNWRGLDVINAHERAPSTHVRGMRDAVDAVLDGTIDPSVLCTSRYPLEQLAEALTAVERRPDGMLKVWVTP